MSSGIQVDVEGFPELRALIVQLGNDRDKKKETVAILRQVAKPALRAARTNAPQSDKPHIARGKRIQSGNLKKSIGIFQARKDPNPNVQVGPRAKGSNDGWYGHFVEKGVNIYRKGFKRKRTKGANAGSAVRRTKANPFMERAFTQTQGQMSANAERQMARFIQRRINRLSR